MLHQISAGSGGEARQGFTSQAAAPPKESEYYESYYYEDESDKPVIKNIHIDIPDDIHDEIRCSEKPL